jgi:NADH dehydrogenase [ubiquinone] 1 alpha subcomplex assembly factor 7
VTQTPLGAELVEYIRHEGPISLARFMALALGHPRYGYYVTRDPLGHAGDFTTAPEISQMFGELVGLWAAQAWSAAGRPVRLALVELGPGRGTLMVDALRAIARALPDLLTALSLHLVETSPVLRQAQASRLALHCPTWHADLSTLPRGPTIVIANEFFDALPIRQFVHVAGLWRERLVGLAENRLAFGLSSEPATMPGLPSAPDGAVIELAEASAAIMGAIARRIARDGGAALVIDYGHLESGFGDTLQALSRHGFADPLDRPGEADLTAHVDFAALARVAAGEGARIEMMMNQADFLDSLGVRERAARLRQRASPEGAAATDAALLRLTDRAPRGMGGLFKVLGLSGGSWSAAAGPV